jgi:hypothetical protein
MITHTQLDKWRADPIKFIETVLVDPETGRGFQVLLAQRDFLEHAFQTDGAGRLTSSNRSPARRRKAAKPASRRFM